MANATAQTHFNLIPTIGERVKYALKDVSLNKPIEEIRLQVIEGFKAALSDSEWVFYSHLDSDTLISNAIKFLMGV